MPVNTLLEASTRLQGGQRTLLWVCVLMCVRAQLWGVCLCACVPMCVHVRMCLCLSLGQCYSAQATITTYQRPEDLTH